MSTKGQIKSVPFCTIFAMYWTVLTVQYKLTRRNVVARRYWIVGGGDRVSIHFAVTFLYCWRTSFCVTKIIKIVNNNTNDKHPSGISGVVGGGGRITLNLIVNVAVIRSFSHKTKILNFFNLFNKIILLCYCC